MKRIFIAFALVVAMGSPALAQLMPSSGVVEFSAVPGQEGYAAGASFTMLFRLKFKEGWHGQSHKPLGEGLVATELALKPAEGISFGRVVYPDGKNVKFDFSDQPLSTYDGTIYLGVTGTVAPEVAAGERAVKASLLIQACNDKSCLMPSDIDITVPMTIAAPGSVVKKINEDIYTANESLFSGGAEKGGGEIADYLKKRGLLLTYIFIFLGGLALNLTPCVYPLIPVTVSYFGGQSEDKKGGIALHAALYILGMASMYSALGLFAALTGGMFGAFLQSPVVTVVIAGAMVALALGMFELYEIRMPTALAEIGGKNRSGFFGTFMMGLTVGVIAAPCIGPFVLGLLTFVGERGNPMLGFTMFFTLAMGLGLPFMILAIFSGSISKLPRSGGWMLWVKQIFGFVLLGMALYFLEPLVPKKVYPYIFGVFMILSGVWLGFVSKSRAKGFARFVVALIFMGVGAYYMIPHEGPRIEWKPATVTAIAEAKKSGVPVVIDFSADWCVPCKELEKFTFAGKQAVDASSRFVMLKADVTRTGDPTAEELKKTYKVAGVPTVVFIGADGAVRDDLGFSGFVNADDFVRRLEKLKGVGR